MSKLRLLAPVSWVALTLGALTSAQGREAPRPEVIPCAEAPAGMACVPGGPFTRGSNTHHEPARPEARIWQQTFFMDIDEVTVESYKACVKARKCDRAGPKYNDFSRPKQPINGISWYDAVKYCKAHGKHLPTEAEWEKAARGDAGELNPYGNEPVTCEQAVIMDDSGRSCGVKKRGKKPEKGRVWEVGKKPAGRYGLRDMAGNSYEWVADWYAKSYAGCGEACLGVNPKGPCEGADKCKGYRRKVVRGGSWYWPAERADGIFRRAHVPSNNPFHHFGFRCAASVDEAKALSAK